MTAPAPIHGARALRGMPANVDRAQGTRRAAFQRRNCALLSLAAAILATALLATSPSAHAQQAFATPDAAFDALVDGLARHDDAEVRRVLGPDYAKVLPLTDAVEDDRTEFLAAWARGHRVDRSGDTAHLALGDGWSLPLPLALRDGAWRFDLAAGAVEMQVRRIGRNELAAINAMKAYADAQREYAEADRNGDGMLEYARRIISRPGHHDGLYWPTTDGEPPSPAGPLLDTAHLKDGYHGYRFRILQAQGPAADGGARSYVRKGRMTDGFGLVAWPARYGYTGVMTFIVNHDGVVYQRDLGPDTAARAAGITRFDPGSGWAAVK